MFSITPARPPATLPAHCLQLNCLNLLLFLPRVQAHATAIRRLLAGAVGFALPLALLFRTAFQTNKGLQDCTACDQQLDPDTTVLEHGLHITEQSSLHIWVKWFLVDETQLV